MYIFLCVSIYKKPLYLLKATRCDSRQSFPTLIQEKKKSHTPHRQYLC